MTTPYEQQPNENPAASDEGVVNSPVVPQRKKLQLKPRSSGCGATTSTSAATTMSTTRPQRQRSLSSKQGGSNNPFGAALPREEILQQRGLDVAKIDDFFEKKAAVRSYTAAQEAELETVRAQLGAITAELRHANEHELPEETFRLAEQAKRQELNDLVEKFGQLNTTATVAEDEQQQQAVRHKAYVPRGAVRNSKDHHHHDEQQHRSYGSHNRSGNGKYNDKKHVEFGRNEEKREDSDAYASFFSNRRRQSHEEQHA